MRKNKSQQAARRESLLSAAAGTQNDLRPFLSISIFQESKGYTRQLQWNNTAGSDHLGFFSLEIKHSNFQHSASDVFSLLGLAVFFLTIIIIIIFMLLT